MNLKAISIKEMLQFKSLKFIAKYIFLLKKYASLVNEKSNNSNSSKIKKKNAMNCFDMVSSKKKIMEKIMKLESNQIHKRVEKLK